MKVGIKLWSTNPSELVDSAGFADFVEVMAADLEGIDKFAAKNYSYTVHVPHESFGFNPLTDYGKSKKLLERAIEAGKMLKAEWLIMHNVHIIEKPDVEKREAAINAVARLVKESGAGNILVENSCSYTFFKGVGEEIHFGFSADDIDEMMKRSGAGFCLDLEHATLTAHHQKRSFEEEVKPLLKLKPDYFHLSGAKHATREHHTSIFNSDLDINYVKEILKKEGKAVCLETPVDVEQRKREVEFLKQD